MYVCEHLWSDTPLLVAADVVVSTLFFFCVCSLSSRRDDSMPPKRLVPNINAYCAHIYFLLHWSKCIYSHHLSGSHHGTANRSPSWLGAAREFTFRLDSYSNEMTEKTTYSIVQYVNRMKQYRQQQNVCVYTLVGIKHRYRCLIALSYGYNPILEGNLFHYRLWAFVEVLTICSWMTHININVPFGKWS